MATLGKIRSKGALLVSVVGFALFAFIAEEAFRSCETSSNDKRQQVGEVFGEKMDYMQFNKLVEEYSEVVKLQQGRDNFNEDEMNQLRDMVWNTYVQNKIIENEAEKLGIKVTDDELKQILAEGTNPMLMQTPFFDRQTNRFDVNALKKFQSEYKGYQKTSPQMAKQYEPVYKYWLFIEKSIRQQLLAQKYQSLLEGCILSNKVEAQYAFNAQSTEYSAQLAALPYSTVKDNEVKVSDEDIKKKYEEYKERFIQAAEDREIKYIDVHVQASAADVAALNKEFDGYAAELATSENVDAIVRKSASSVSYLGVPVLKDAYPYDIRQQLDSMAVGATSRVITSKQDNTLNVIKLVSRQQLPDSVQYRRIEVAGATADEIAKRADSIMTALRSGADFEALAKVYGQSGEKTWITTRQYQTAPSLDKDTKEFINSLNTLASGEYKTLAFTQGSIILQVTERKAMTNKYMAAVIKKKITFSNDTYNAAFNKFSSFVSANLTAEELIKNAPKSGYTVSEATVSTMQHNIAGIRDTKEAMRWLFEAKKGDVSQLYQCGNNEHMMVIVVDGINPVGYRSMDDPQLREFLKSEVIKDKKAEMLMAKLAGVKTVAEAKAKGAVVVDVNQVTYASPVFVPATGASEAALSGAITATAKGKFSKKPVKGNMGVYVFTVTGVQQGKGKFDVKSEMQRLRMKNINAATRLVMNELYLGADIKDNRYMFF